MPENPAGPTCHRIGAFELDSRSGELRKHNHRIRLPEKPFRLLAILVERAGEVVTREELRHRLWPEDTFVDFDNSLNTAVNRVREALADSAEKPRYIETLPKRGYRFIAPVEVLPAHAHPAPSQAFERTPPSAMAARRKTLWAGASLGVVVLVAVGVWAGHSLLPMRAVTAKGKVTLAVLPFANLSGDPSQDYFSDGLTEEMITRLAGLSPEHLGVVARTSAMQYKGTNKDTRQIGHDLGVDYLLEGSVQRDDNRVRITAQLIRVRDQSHLWAEDFERDLRDILGLQSEVARDIAQKIELNLTAEQHTRLASTRPIHLEAYDLYLQGRYFWNKRTEEGYRRAIRCFEKAVESDPSYAQSYAGLADSYVLLGSMGNATMPQRQAMARARTAAEKAVELDDSLADAHTSLALVKVFGDWDWAAGEREFRRALQLNPNYATAHHWYGYSLMLMGRHEEALREVRQAQELDPLSLIIGANFGYVAYCARQYDQAIEQYRKTLDLDPNFPVVHGYLALAYEQKGMTDQAVNEFNQAIHLSGGTPEYLAARGHVYAVQGKTHEARRAIEELRQKSQQMSVPAWSFALVYAGLGDVDKTFEWLEKAYREHSTYLMELKVDPRLDRVQADSRFADLVQRVGLTP